MLAACRASPGDMGPRPAPAARVWMEAAERYEGPTGRYESSTREWPDWAGTRRRGTPRETTLAVVWGGQPTARVTILGVGWVAAVAHDKGTKRIRRGGGT